MSEQLWAPWRLSYITKGPPPKTEGPECFICRAVQSTNDAENLVFLRTEWSVGILNRYPYNNGHLLICPQAHKASLSDLTDAELLDLQKCLTLMQGLLTEIMNPDGFNIGLNVGRAAGAGVPGHLHWHLVPRWNGDTNFIPVLTDTRIISLSLETLYQQIQEKLAKQN